MPKINRFPLDEGQPSLTRSAWKHEQDPPVRMQQALVRDRLGVHHQYADDEKPEGEDQNVLPELGIRSL